MIHYLLILAGWLGYGLVGTATTHFGLRTEQLIYRRIPDHDMRVGYGLAGVFWPICIWFVLHTFLSAPKPVKDKDLDALAKREKSIYEREENLKLDIREQQIRMQEIAFEKQRTKEIEQ